MQTLQKNYNSFTEACDGVIEILKDNQQKQFKIRANFEGRSFKVITERGKLINSNYFNDDDFIDRMEFRVYERKVTVYATDR